MRTQDQRTNGGATRHAPRALGGVVALGLLLGSLAAAPPARAATVDVGGRTFDVQSATVGQDHYQVAYSERNDVVWVTATTHNWDSGAPRADVSTISKLNPQTLQVISTITPRTLDAGTAGDGAAVGDGTDDEFDVGVGQVRPASGAQVVEHPDAGAGQLAEQAVDDGGADEAGAAGHQHEHGSASRSCFGGWSDDHVR